MTHSLTMDQPDRRDRLDDMHQGLVGKPLDRPDGPLKVAGIATYASEWNLPGTAYGVFARAEISAGKVESIESDSAMKMPSVLGVYSDERFLNRPAQGGTGEAPVQGASKVSYFAQPIALVVAETFEAATAAAKALKITYTEIESDSIFDAEHANAEIEEDDEPVVKGDLEHAMQTAAFTVDEIYRTLGHASAAMEPHAAIASWNGHSLTLRGSYQMLNFNAPELADALGIADSNVRILSPYVGGGFGSKLGISHEAIGAAIAAKDLDRPVRVDLSRQQVFETIMRRSETRQRIRLAADEDGKLIGIGHECLVSNLPGESFAEPVTQATEFLYGGDARRTSVDLARVQLMCAGSVRAPGEAVGLQTLESAMDQLAEKMGVDPVELRKRNIPEKNPSDGTAYSSRKLAECLDQGAERFGWQDRQSEPCSTREGEWWIGTGMASAARVNILSHAQARVTLNANGSATVATDMTDIGTGSYAILGQIAGEMLGIPVKQVEVQLGDSALPSGPGSGGSWGAASSGSAVFQACEKIRMEIARKMGGAETNLSLRDGQALLNDKAVALVDLLKGNTIEADGEIKPGTTLEDLTQASYGAFFVEVAVNAYTGETRVRRMTGVFGIGRVLNLKTATSQCYGGMVWGIGSALTEELIFDHRDGNLVNHDLAEYHVPVNLDVPQIDASFVEERDHHASPIQAKGVGELGICGAAGAIANAVYNACGVRVRDFPITLDKIIAELPQPQV